jgi:hypothetical protein
MAACKRNRDKNRANKPEASYLVDTSKLVKNIPTCSSTKRTGSYYNYFL